MLMRFGEWQVGRSRWLNAQKYEQAFWERLGADIAVGAEAQLEWYNWRARRLEERLAGLPNVRTDNGKVLEIGCGPIGIINFLSSRDRVAVDPLEHFYRRTPSLVSLRQPGVTYLTGTGEQLPVKTGSCALVIIDNVIDHTQAPGRILDEIRRVLQPYGSLYLSVNVHTRWGALLHRALAALQIDPGHPYTFTSSSLRRLLGAHGFSVIGESIDSYTDARRADRRAPQLKARIKGYTGLSEFSHAVVCRQPMASGPAPHSNAHERLD
jgi:SAM-dependent methyltransferase